MELSKQEKLKLIEFFEFLLNEEASKPLDEMNTEVIDAYVKILLNLQDKHIKLSSDFINEQVRKIFHPEEITAAPETAKTTKKHYNKKKIWLVAACISILLALFSIASFSSERSVIDVLEDFIGTFEFIPFGKEIDIGNESYGREGDGKEYKKIEHFLENESMNILLPKTLKVETISVSTFKNKTDIYVTFDKSTITLSVKLDSTIDSKTKSVCNEIKTIDNVDYYILDMQDIHQVQAYFTYNNDFYTVIAENKNDLMNILNNMEEIKNEN